MYEVSDTRKEERESEKERRRRRGDKGLKKPDWTGAVRRGDCPRSTDRTQNLSRSTILDPLDNFLPVGTQSTEPPKESDRWGGHPEIDFLVEEIHGWVGFRYWCHFICRVGCTGWTVVILMVPVSHFTCMWVHDCNLALTEGIGTWNAAEIEDVEKMKIV